MQFPVNYIDIKETFIDNKNIAFGYNPDDPYVYSIEDGEVILNTYQNKYNNIIYIKHPNGLISMYKRLDNTFVTTGQIVKRGDKIGTIGSTIGSQKKYLLFGLFSENSTYLNNASNLDSLDYLQIYPNQKITLSSTNNYGIKIKYYDTTSLKEADTNLNITSSKLFSFTSNPIDIPNTSNFSSNNQVIIIIPLIVLLIIIIFKLKEKVGDYHE